MRSKSLGGSNWRRLQRICRHIGRSASYRAARTALAITWTLAQYGGSVPEQRTGRVAVVNDLVAPGGVGGVTAQRRTARAASKGEPVRARGSLMAPVLVVMDELLPRRRHLAQRVVTVLHDVKHALATSVEGTRTADGRTG